MPIKLSMQFLQRLIGLKICFFLFEGRIRHRFSTTTHDLVHTVTDANFAVDMNWAHDSVTWTTHRLNRRSKDAIKKNISRICRRRSSFDSRNAVYFWQYFYVIGSVDDHLMTSFAVSFGFISAIMNMNYLLPRSSYLTNWMDFYANFNTKLQAPMSMLYRMAFGTDTHIHASTHKITMTVMPLVVRNLFGS